MLAVLHSLCKLRKDRKDFQGSHSKRSVYNPEVACYTMPGPYSNIAQFTFSVWHTVLLLTGASDDEVVLGPMLSLGIPSCLPSPSSPLLAMEGGGRAHWGMHSTDLLLELQPLLFCSCPSFSFFFLFCLLFCFYRASLPKAAEQIIGNFV
jgi:hypothetical protein